MKQVPGPGVPLILIDCAFKEAADLCLTLKTRIIELCPAKVVQDSSKTFLVLS